MTTNPKRRAVIFAVAIVWILACLIRGFSGFLLCAPFALIVLGFVPPLRAPAVGMPMGWLVWFYDEDFGVNVGGPEAPITKAIQHWLGLRWDNDTAPVLLLMLAGGCI